ncbi:zf-HC2 domain-containing protein [Lysinibacillus xylanilyticus]|uniref:zf-HC2 domain-containing protein n=1 Tax=Lysinibacillus xylanilyticus TaxID=582475 RepID=UPI003D045577
MNCNIIKDLMPSYIDQVCSKETVTAIEEHIEQCQKCKKALQLMQQPPVKKIETNVAVAKEPFKRINKKRRFQVITAILMTFILTIIGSLVVQDVGVVNDFFFPKVYANVDIEDGMEDWQSIRFTDFHFNDQDYLMYGRLFGEKKIVNDANSESDVLLRVKDAKGDVIIDEILIPPGKSVKLEDLKRGEKYYLEIKASPGHFTINAV